MIDAASYNGHEITGYWKDEAMEEVVSAYPAKIMPHVIERISRMAGLGRGMELDPKPFWKLGTSLTTTPRFIAYAMLPKRDA
jgi:hypothetical protein